MANEYFLLVNKTELINNKVTNKPTKASTINMKLGRDIYFRPKILMTHIDIDFENTV